MSDAVADQVFEALMAHTAATDGSNDTAVAVERFVGCPSTYILFSADTFLGLDYTVKYQNSLRCV